MILSGSINLFDGAELLPPLLRTLRPVLDHISVVYQLRSNRGNRHDPEMGLILSEVRRDGLLDDLACYQPDQQGLSPARHEARKRTIGLDLARRAGATHFMSLDVDEFYRPAELALARRQVEIHGYDATACRVQNYHRRPTYRCVGLDTYLGHDLYVPLICEIGGGVFDPGIEYFCCVDPTRRLPYTNPHIFGTDEMVMQHMTTVRRSHASLVAKFANSSSRSPFEDPVELADLVWNFEPSADRRPLVEAVVDEFGVEDWFNRCTPTLMGSAVRG